MENITDVPAAGRDGDTACILTNMADGSAASQRYYLARRTLMEMLRDRGYEVTDVEAELRRSIDDFRATFGEVPDPDALRLVAPRVSDPSRAMMAIFCGPFDINKPTIVGLMGKIMNTQTLDRVILVRQGNINSYAQKFLDGYSVKVDVFQINDLVVNITKHCLVPKLEILTPEEKLKILEKYNIQDKQLPMMLGNDAIARYYGLEKGQVVKVTYSSAITGLLVSYRCVR